jgi:ribonuclease HI
LDDRRDVEQSNPVVSWIPLSRNMVKINFDAALDSKKLCVGLGLLARDEQGHFWVACGLNQTIVVDPTMAEALAALHAVLFAKELGFSNVIF